MGGRSAGGRDRIMENLIADHIAEASTARTATMIAEAVAGRDDRRARRPARSAAGPLAAARRADHASPTGTPNPRPRKATTPTETTLRPRRTAAAVAMRRTSRRRPSRTPAAPEGVKGPSGGAAPKERHSDRPAQATALLLPPERPQGPARDGHRKYQQTPEQTTTVARAQAQSPDQSEDRGRDSSPARGGWMIQIGATDDPSKANALLIRARERNRAALAAARPVTEKVRKGDGTLYRARFAVLDFGIGRIRLPLAQTQWIFLLPRPRLTSFEAACRSGAPSSLVVASEHPWPD